MSFKDELAGKNPSLKIFRKRNLNIIKVYLQWGHTVDHITQNLPDPHADARQSAILSKRFLTAPKHLEN